MMKLTPEQNYRLCQAALVMLVAGAAYCFRQMSPYAGTAHNVHWFIALVTIIAIMLPVGIAFYYYRSKRNNRNTDEIAVQTLANLNRTDSRK